MTRNRFFVGLLGCFFSFALGAAPVRDKFVLVIHGGAGHEKADFTDSEQKQLREALEMALRSGYDAMNKSHNSLDGVEAAIRVMEDCPLLNAGKGAVFNHEGKNELDASIMDGKTKKAGAVAGVTIVKNPISAARAVMEKTWHVLLAGRGADQFAKNAGLEIVDPKYFYTDRQWKELQKALKEEKEKEKAQAMPKTKKHSYRPFGKVRSTVGAVALDSNGNISAGTSTGGLTNKQWGRVGDSPIIGAGTYAENETAGISCTGSGEYFIRLSVAHDIVSLMKYKEWSAQKAADEVIQKKLTAMGGDGGVIVLDHDGQIAYSYNSESLFRGSMTESGKIDIKLYEKE